MIDLGNKYVNRLLQEDGVYVAGGCLRHFFDPKEAINDYDVFFNNIQAKTTCGYILDMVVAHGQGNLVFKCPEGLLSTYRIGEAKIQLISKDYYYGVRHLINTFDYLPCCLGVERGSDTIVQLNGAEQSIKDKILVVNRITYPYASLKRALKYKGYGYDVHAAIHACSWIINNTQLSPEEEVLYID